MKAPDRLDGQSVGPRAPAARALSPEGQRLLGTLGREGPAAIWFLVILGAVFAWGVVAYLHQLRRGLAVTAMTDYFSWGIYIINFVFFIGISMAGSLISAILRLTGAKWRHPITRMAEGITVFALIAAALMIIVDMGRPERLWHIVEYGRLQSPILWDVFSLTSYLAGSLLFLYLPLIPDLAILRDQGARFAPWRQRLYRRLALGWTGAPDQHRRLDRTLTLMSIVIIPVAVSIHTVTAWLFGMTLRPGWHSTIIGPDFVVGALYSGVAAVLTVMAVAVWKWKLNDFVTTEHFRKLGLLLLVLCVAYAYFMVNEYIGGVYTQEKTEWDLVRALFQGTYAIQFWSMAVIGLVIPGMLLAWPRTRTVSGIVTASVLANVGMWLKRYIIVVPTLSTPFLPVEPAPGKIFAYVPTWVEWSITAGGFAGLLLFYCLFAKVVPIVSIWETEASHGPESQAPSLPAARRDAQRAHSPSMAVLVLALILGGSAGAPRARAAEPSAPARPTVSLSVDTEDRKRMIVATVRLQGKPLEDVKVAFSVQRLFGQLSLGTDTTLDDGTAAVAFPTDVPGGPAGRIEVRAQIREPARYAGIGERTTLGGALKYQPPADPFPRALWAPRAPVAVLAALAAILGTVWGAYAYVAWQIVQIRKGGGQ